MQEHALALGEIGFHSWEAGKIAEFCQSGDFEVAHVLSGGRITPTESNQYYSIQVGRENGRQNMFAAELRNGVEKWKNDRGRRGFEQRFQGFQRPQGFDQRRADDTMNRAFTRNQKRGQSVWEAAMRNSYDKRQEPMCGQEECGLDAYLGERDSLERLLGSEPDDRMDT
jgi:hypothetical protein